MPTAAPATVAPLFQELPSEHHQTVLEIIIDALDEFRRFARVQLAFTLFHRVRETPYCLPHRVWAIRSRRTVPTRGFRRPVPHSRQLARVCLVLGRSRLSQLRLGRPRIAA